MYGLGVDQILGDKLFNYKCDLIEVSEELLKGIRGAGHIFGVIVELTIKVFPLSEVRISEPGTSVQVQLTDCLDIQMLISTLIYESSDMQSVWKSLTESIGRLTLPPAL